MRDPETGNIANDSDKHDWDIYEALPPGRYNNAFAHVVDEYGVEPGRDPVATDSSDAHTSRRQRRVRTHCGSQDCAVTLGQFTVNLGTNTTDDGNTWLCSTTGGLSI